MTTTPPAPTLTVRTTADPCPRVEVVITPMPVDASTITVYRSWRGQRGVVRGAQGAAVAGTFLVVDYEAPLGTAVDYSCVTADVSGVPSQESPTSTVTVSVADVWMQDPLDPTSAIRVPVEGTSGVTIIGDSIMPATYAMDITEVPVAGSMLPVAVGATRRAASQMPMTVMAWSPADAATVRDLLQQAFPLALRTPAAVPQLTGLTYLSSPQVQEVALPGWQRTQFLFPSTSVRGPGAGIVVQPRTYDDLLDEAATYTALQALYATYLDVQRG